MFAQTNNRLPVFLIILPSSFLSFSLHLLTSFPFFSFFLPLGALRPRGEGGGEAPPGARPGARAPCALWEIRPSLPEGLEARPVTNAEIPPKRNGGAKRRRRIMMRSIKEDEEKEE